jgi:alpha-galactosidase
MEHLSAGGVSVVIDDRGQVVHWGAALPDDDPSTLAAALTPPLPRASFDVPVPLTLTPSRADGWRGRPAYEGSDPQRADSPPIEGLTLNVVPELQIRESGVVVVRSVVRNEGTEPMRVGELACILPVPNVAAEVLDLTGRWCRERHPQRRAFDQGIWMRQTRHGRTGHDSPLLLVAGTQGFGFRHGEVWGIHLAWSGDASWWAERLPDGSSVLGAAELGDVVVAPGDEYATPWVYAAWSDEGLDGLSARLHRFIRARPTHPRRARPVVLNTWEAVYFDHRLDRLKGLADTAADLGVERFVLDDGWFRGRRDDTAGLGDWYVDEDVWPDGLHPLIEHVRSLGMEFGLWVEPEMVNPDSDLARAHPDWVLPGPPWRHQQGLDVTQAYDYLLERLDALLTEYDIDYLKWDHNRDLVTPSHEQTLTTYRLLDELRARHPEVEIESCSSGGARVDLGILERTDRVWASDTNDALERQNIQRWTQLLLPPELVGSHVGPPTAHTTGRTHDLSFRAATALFGHFGIEWDISAASDEERAELREWIARYKRWRALLHSGEVVRIDLPDPAFALHGVVAADRSEALFCFVALATSASERPGAVRLAGLDPDRRYRVNDLPLSGRALMSAGLQMPILGPEQAVLIEVCPGS